MSLKKRSAPKGKNDFNLSRLKEDIDTYTEGIYAVVAFINHSRWSESDRRLRESVPYGIGRRLAVSPENRIVAAGTEVTPDCAIQMSPTHGILAEAKPGVTRLPAAWEDNIKQLQKYDDNLKGWWTRDGLVRLHDIVALLPVSRVVDFVDLLKARIGAGTVTFNRPLVVVAFWKQTGAQRVFINLKTEHGSVSDAEVANRLRRAVPVDWSTLLVSYNDPKFIDSEPPLPYTLWVLWDLMLASRATGREPESKTNWIGLDVGVAELTEDVRRYYGFPSGGERSVEIPRRRWIRKALDALVIFGKAERVAEGKYHVKYKRNKNNVDTIKVFGQLCHTNRDRLARAFATKPLIAAAEGGPVQPPDASDDGAS